MDNDVIWLSVLLPLVGIVIGLVVMYFVIRAAILSALDEDRRRMARAQARPAPTTHLDQDGL